MSSVKTPSNQVFVNLFGQTSAGDRNMRVWKVQKAPEVDIRVGQVIWFESDFFFGGKEVAYRPEKSDDRILGRYEGRVQNVVGWQKHWIRFGVEDARAKDGFQLWVPIDWTALGVVLRLRHMVQRHLLGDTIPLPPTTTEVALQTRMTYTSQGARIRREREVAREVTGTARDWKNEEGV
jgi:hypothetical protein